MERFAEYAPANIYCGEGWHQLIVNLDIELSKIDPNYVVVQIKEKFGTLRYYIETDVSKRKQLKMREIIMRYELLSSKTCEISGGPGVLMRGGGNYKTMDPRLAPEMYQVVQ